MLTIIMIFIYYFEGRCVPKRVSNSQGLTVITFLANVTVSHVIRRLLKQK